ncbi:MAG: hypothetical protein ACTSVL_08865, partial [Promethearchaeota archaeon]
MIYPTKSPDYETVRLSWPEWLPYRCSICDGQIIFKGTNAGKKVHTLSGVIYQVTNLYECTNEN